MDDDLEQPTHEVKFPSENVSVEEGEDGPASDDDDGGPDWTKLMFVTRNSPMVDR